MSAKAIIYHWSCLLNSGGVCLHNITEITVSLNKGFLRWHSMSHATRLSDTSPFLLGRFKWVYIQNPALQMSYSGLCVSLLICCSIHLSFPPSVGRLRDKWSSYIHSMDDLHLLCSLRKSIIATLLRKPQSAHLCDVFLLRPDKILQ